MRGKSRNVLENNGNIFMIIYESISSPVISGNAQRLQLALYSGLNSGGGLGNTSGARDQTWDGHMQDKCTTSVLLFHP